MVCRYLNSVAAKALFRAGKIEEAEAVAAKFTKHGDQVNSLTEMQAMWYEIECGHAHLRTRAYGKVRLGDRTLSSYPHSLLHSWNCLRQQAQPV